MDKAILLVGNFLSRGGKTTGPGEELASRLAALGWQVVTTSRQQGKVARLVDMLWTAWCQRRCYTAAHVDVFSGPAFTWAELVCWLLKLLGKPYILTLHGGNLPTFARRWPGRVHKLINSAIVVTAPSSYLFKEFKEYRDNLRLIPNALQIERYVFRKREKPRQALIWLRSFHGIYNPELAVRVMALLAPDIELNMVGPDKGDGSLARTKELASKLDIADRIGFPGKVEKRAVPLWLDSADIFINTTNVDNTPVSVMEAMACGLCVVSTNVGGIPYLLDHETDALLVPPDDPEAMAAAVRRILTEPGLAERLSCNARKKAEQFDWSIILPQWEALLIKVAQGKEQ